MSDKKVAAIQRRHDTWTQEFQVRGCATEALLGFQDYCLAHDDREYLLAELTRLHAEHESLVERLRGLDRWRIAGGRSAIYRNPIPDKPQHYEWLHTGEVIRAADLEGVLGKKAT